FGFERDVDDRITVDAVGRDIGAHPACELRIVAAHLLEDRRPARQLLERRGCEIGADALKLALLDFGRSLGTARIFGLDLGLEFLRAELVDQDLDARLELIVASSIEIVDAHDGLEIADELVLGQEVAHRDADDRRSPLAAPDDHFPAALVPVVEMKPEADVMYLDRGAVMGGAGDCNLALARQKRKFRM